MKTLSKIKLNQFSKDELDQRKLNALKGGGCGCPCACAGSDRDVDAIMSDKNATGQIYAY
jgi:natural product precursor